jgi:hypothetical protein
VTFQFSTQKTACKSKLNSNGKIKLEEISNTNSRQRKIQHCMFEAKHQFINQRLILKGFTYPLRRVR